MQKLVWKIYYEFQAHTRLSVMMVLYLASLYDCYKPNEASENATTDAATTTSA